MKDIIGEVLGIPTRTKLTSTRWVGTSLIGELISLADSVYL